jgi:hypothetical protein
MFTTTIRRLIDTGLTGRCNTLIAFCLAGLLSACHSHQFHKIASIDVTYSERTPFNISVIFNNERQAASEFVTERYSGTPYRREWKEFAGCSLVEYWSRWTPSAFVILSKDGELGYLITDWPQNRVLRTRINNIEVFQWGEELRYPTRRVNSEKDIKMRCIPNFSPDPLPPLQRPMRPPLTAENMDSYARL